MSPEITRARRLLMRPYAWIEAAGAAYALRVGPDRRSRVLTTLDEAAFRQLIETPGLRARPGGGAALAASPLRSALQPPPARAFRPGSAIRARKSVSPSTS